MYNYIKSEWYRITHSSTIYIFTATLAGLALMINFILYFMSKYKDGFRYGTTAFSLSMLSNMTILLYMGLILVSLIFAGEKKNGILKNPIAFGISREKIFLGKCLVSTGISICSLVVILVVYIGSAVLLLESGVEPNAAFIILRGVACTLVMAVAFEVFTIALCSFFEKESLTFVVWYLVVVIIPQICRIIGLDSELFRRIAAWMPYNYFRSEVIANMSGWSCLWETPEGVAKCLISGVIGLIVFLLLGLKICKKQEV